MVAEVKELQRNNTAIERMHRIFDAQKAAFRQHPYPSAEQRIELMGRFKPLLLDNIDAWVEAVSNDFSNRAADETKLAEIMLSLEALKYNSKKLRKWMKAEKRSVSALSWPGKTWVEYQPLGVVGIIVPWNYPIQLALVPMLTALAAGNRVMVKMSEATPRTGALLEKLVSEAFPVSRWPWSTAKWMWPRPSPNCPLTTCCSPAPPPWASTSCAPPPTI